MSLDKFLGNLYQYEIVKRAKDVVRPIKHFVFGKNGIYRIMDEIASLSGGAENVRTIFDVGAAEGEYSVHFLRKFPYAAVYCFEPAPESFEKLARRVAKYGERAKTFNFAFWNRNGSASFYLSNHRDSSSFFRKKELPARVSVRRLDDFVKEEKIGNIDFIKIDVEGAEKEVFDGGAETFKKKIQEAFIEITPSIKGYYSPDYAELLRRLHGCGFGFGGVFGDFFFSKRLPR